MYRETEAWKRHLSVLYDLEKIENPDWIILGSIQYHRDWLRHNKLIFLKKLGVV